MKIISIVFAWLFFIASCRESASVMINIADVLACCFCIIFAAVSAQMKRNNLKEDQKDETIRTFDECK